MKVACIVTSDTQSSALVVDMCCVERQALANSPHRAVASSAHLSMAIARDPPAPNLSA